MFQSILRNFFIGISLYAILFDNTIYVTSEEETDHAKRLWDTLFVNNSYNKFIRPVKDHKQTLIMEASLNLVAIMDVDVVEEKLTTTAFLGLIWSDENLEWDPALYDDITEVSVSCSRGHFMQFYSKDFNPKLLLIPQTEVWTPDMALDNGFSKMKALGDKFVLVKVQYDGTVIWHPYEVFETKCAMKVEYFPFDNQTCNINVGVWTSEIDKIHVRVPPIEVDLEHFQKNSEWDLTGWTAHTFTTKTDNAMIQFSISLKRKHQYYLYNVVAPILMLSILAIFTFAIPTESGEKLGFCMTVYLAFAVFLTIVSTSLPVSSVLSLLGKYLIFLLIIGTLIVAICTLEHRIHFRHSSREIPGCFRGLVRLSLVLQCRSCQRQKVDSTLEKTETTDIVPGEDSDKISWMEVSSAIDFYCFWIFLVAVTSGTLVLFLAGSQRGSNTD
ncbi:neuronal acetylcholine receptor subunit alpha-6-like [Pecten maximus]|uniref:neuronal acetylcholine receptor subunit alpha-6-like n=1 Tax=Pecten maximus TaxID=6579 RepID=UPI001458C799|nr:neuronal acetylcholine receptor subunit alpha-6-like [Pecten maximus]